MKQITEYFSKEKISSMPIDEYLSTKVAKPMTRNFGEFPIEPDVEKIVEFLRNQGFAEVDHRFGHMAINELSCTHKYENRFVYDIFTSDNHTHDSYWVRFCKAGEITKETPAFFCKYNTKVDKRLYETSFVCEHIDNGYEFYIKKWNDFDSFREEVNKYFGW